MPPGTAAPDTITFPSARAMRADVFAARGDDQRTAVLVSHGGGWRVGGPEHMHPRCAALAEHGFTVVAIEYRLLGEAPWPAPLDDVRAAVRWARDNADQLGIEPDRIALQGHSAGAHLSLLTAYTPDPDAGADDPGVAAVVAFYPPVGFFAGVAPVPDPETGRPPRAPRRDDGRAPAWMLLDDSDDEEQARAISPFDQITASSPPTMIVQGAEDPMVTMSSSLAFHRALFDAGVPADLHVLHGVGHEFDNAPTMTATVADDVSRFLRRTVSQSALIAEEIDRHDAFKRRAAAVTSLTS
jgi:acetyl esterase/lipase